MCSFSSKKDVLLVPGESSVDISQLAEAPPAESMLQVKSHRPNKRYRSTIAIGMARKRESRLTLDISVEVQRKRIVS